MLNTENRNIMKKGTMYTIATGVIFLLIFSVLPAGATENVEVNAIEQSKTIRMELNTPASEMIEVTLYGRFDRVLYNDRICAGETYEDKFDFSAVKKGSYKLVSQLRNMKFNRVIQVSEQGVEITERYFTFAPQFRQEGDTLKVHFLNQPNKNIGIAIDEAWGNVYDAFYFQTDDIFSVNYDLRKLPEGTYTLQLMHGSETYTHEFSID